MNALPSQVSRTVRALLAGGLSLVVGTLLEAAGVIELPRTGQTHSFAVGDDGALQLGAAWPSPRFTDHGDGTVIDRLTGLMWTQDANVMTTRDPSFDTDGARDGKVLWTRALDYVARLNRECFLGHRDWRLPNLRELASLIDHEQANPCLSVGHPFLKVQPAYFSSTSYELSRVWGVRFSNLHANARSGEITDLAAKRTDPYPVWPVRTAGSGAVKVPRTGQTRGLYAGDDGHLRLGEPLPAPRFVALADGTVRDRLTGLMWPQHVTEHDGGSSWNDLSAQLTAINATNYLGHADWRLPNRWEAWSLVDFGENQPAMARDHPFSFTETAGFWTSTTDASATNEAFLGQTFSGVSSANRKVNLLPRHLWPVRTDSAPLPTGSMTGQVTVAGASAGGVVVSLVGPLNGVVVTEANGRFDFNHLPTGTYTVAVAKLHYDFSPASRTLTLADSDPPGLTFTGTLTNSLGWIDWSDRVTRFNADFSEVQFVTRDEGWITSSSVNEIYHTTDGGQSWEVQKVALPCNAIHMRNALEGYAGGQSGFIYRTTNGGLNWSFIGTLGQPLSDIEFPPTGDTGYACGMEGTAARIVGSRVERMNIGGIVSGMNAISFPFNADEGWMAGDELILHYTGGSWEADQSHMMGSGSDIEFVDLRNGWWVGSTMSYQRGILGTTDGLNWHPQLPPNEIRAVPTSVDFLDANEGWVVGFEGLILHTTIGGGYWLDGPQVWTNGWTLQAPGLTQADLTSVCAVDRETVYAVGNQGALLRYSRLGQAGPSVRLALASLTHNCGSTDLTLEWQPPVTAAAVETSPDLTHWSTLVENAQGGRWTGPAPSDSRPSFFRLRLSTNP